jgi:7-cyano-7-deazaguanine reductase
MTTKEPERKNKKRNWSKNREILKSIPNPSRDAYEIKMKVPELTFEGVRSQPDFAHLYITFYPGDKVIELKSLKEYFFAFRRQRTSLLDFVL